MSSEAVIIHALDSKLCIGTIVTARHAYLTTYMYIYAARYAHGTAYIPTRMHYK